MRRKQLAALSASGSLSAELARRDAATAKAKANAQRSSLLAAAPQAPPQGHSSSR